jgi:UDP-N-acetylglucosamine 2-epimerase (non-hydrolysing)
MKKSDIAVVVGTRPGIIKMAPIVWVLQKQKIPHFIIHTGQHYSAEMDDVFMRELDVTSNVFRVSESHRKTLHGEKTAHMLMGVEIILYREKPGAVLVCGDANTNLAAGLAARKLHILLGHVESGLRSWDWRMPEEHNRVMLDHISELLFAPTKESVENLQRESVRGEIHLTGNTIVDALMQGNKKAEQKSHVLKSLGLAKKEYLLLTTHREENVDNENRLSGILEGMDLILDEIELPIIFPIHPRTNKRIRQMNLSSNLEKLENKGLKVVEPLGYFDFLALLNTAEVVMTDSGGLQEEACILGKKTITLRNNTERPETIEAGTNVIAGTEPKVIYEKVMMMLKKSVRKVRHPFGDGKAAERIAQITVRALNKGLSLSRSPQVRR